MGGKGCLGRERGIWEGRGGFGGLVEEESGLKAGGWEMGIWGVKERMRFERLVREGFDGLVGGRLRG